MSDSMVSKLPDADMQGAPKAMLRAALRAREIALQTNTPLAVMRDGVLVEEYVTGEVSQAGKLDALISEAMAEYKAGKSTPL